MASPDNKRLTTSEPSESPHLHPLEGSRFTLFFQIE